MLTLKQKDYPVGIRNLDQIPKQLLYAGSNPINWLDRPRLAVIGSRRMSAYGQAVTKKLASEAAQAGIVIISGLALGIDGLAHRAAIEVGGVTVAVLPGSLSKVYPASHQGLANEIIKCGGTLMTENSEGSEVFKQSFIARNRIIAGLSQGVLITEASLSSGSLHTANFALELGIPVLAVPGSIFSDNSSGTNQLIKTGAQMVQNVEDIFLALGYTPTQLTKTNLASINLSSKQARVLELIKSGAKHQDELMSEASIDYKALSANLTWLEINGLIRPLGAGQWVAI